MPYSLSQNEPGGRDMESIRRYEMSLADPNVDENKINILFDKLADLGGKLGAKLVNRSYGAKTTCCD